MAKRSLYIGGISDEATQEQIAALFAPFGEIMHLEMPLDSATGRHKAFAFLEYEDHEDAEEAIFNMNHSEFMGKQLKVNYSRPRQATGSSARAIWDDEDWIHKRLAQDAEKVEEKMDEAEVLLKGPARPEDLVPKGPSAAAAAIAAKY
eukprot:tig00021043_g17622.t1